MKKVVSACAVSLLFVSPVLAQESTETQSATLNMQLPSMPNMNVNMQVHETHTQSDVVPQTTVQQTTVRQTTVYTSEMQPPPPPPPADCGTGPDPDCAFTRRGRYPMDAESFRGLLDSLRGNPNELEREDATKSALEDNAITAKQLSLVLDLFQNEVLRMEVAEAAAPHLVKPTHALGLASKFQNSIYRTDFSKLISEQRD